MKDVVFFGYSGHSLVCIEIAKLMNYSIFGYYDLDMKNDNPYSLNYLGYYENLVPDKLYFISIGDNQIRKKIYNTLKEKFCDFITLIHPNSVISSNANIGNATVISAGVIINCFVTIGNCCIINTGSIIEHETIISSFVHVAPGVVIAGNVIIDSGTFIGANSVIKQGVRITKNCIIGAGSVVINDILESGTYVGNPARCIIKN